MCAKSDGAIGHSSACRNSRQVGRGWRFAIEDHVAGLGYSYVDAEMQGNGVEMLRDAMTDAKLAKAIRELKADGARFVVCRNTLVSRGYEPAELFEVTEADGTTQIERPSPRRV